MNTSIIHKLGSNNMKDKIPYIVQFHGFKRLLANQNSKYIPIKFNRLIELFSGVASISINCAFY